MATIESLIADHKAAIVKQWVEAVVKTYPEETVPFFLREKDRFANPVVGLLSESLEKVINGLAAKASDNELSDSLDYAIRPRAVQNFTAAQAVAFVFLLKRIVRDAAGAKERDEAGLFSQFDRKIDELALIAFNKYVECREKIFEIRAYEVRNRTFRAFERAGLVADPESDS